MSSFLFFYSVTNCPVSTVGVNRHTELPEHRTAPNRSTVPRAGRDRDGGSGTGGRQVKRATAKSTRPCVGLRGARSVCGGQVPAPASVGPEPLGPRRR